MQQGITATVGMFDGVHRGHAFIIERLKESNPYAKSPLVITFPRHPLNVIKPDAMPKLLTSADDKTSLLCRLGVDVAMIDFDNKLRELTSSQFIKYIKDTYGVKRLMIGFNNKFGSDRQNGFEDYQKFGRELGVEIISCGPLSTEGIAISSSIIRKLIEKGNIEEANRMLGRPFFITGKVVKGHQIGRTLGFPTANILPHDTSVILPPNGVYVAEVTLSNGKKYRSVVNIGVRPTVDNTGKLSIEAHIIGLDKDIYGSNLTLEFLTRLREEKKFADLASLQTQIQSDLAHALSYSK